MCRRLVRVLDRARFPDRRSKYANHTYSNRQHLILVALKEYAGLSYRRWIDVVHAATRIQEELRLERIPHFTTLEKFEQRQDVARLESILVAFIQEFRIRTLYPAVDATGYQTTKASAHYTMVVPTRGGCG